MPVSIKVKDAAVTVVLDKLLPGMGISYVVNKKQIALNKKRADRTPAASDSKNARMKVYGTVTDSNGEPLIGVSVVGGKGSVGRRQLCCRGSCRDTAELLLYRV